jgi:DEAD/DEAH box helicase
MTLASGSPASSTASSAALPALLVRTPPGTGKTFAVQQALADRGVRALYVTPTHELGEQVERDLRSAGVSTHRWRAGPTEEDGCPERDLVQFFRDLNYRIRLGPCRDCPKERGCPYRRVFRSRANQRAQVLIVTSWHLRRSDLWELRALENRPLVILDEDATTALAAPVELRDDRLRNFVEHLDALRHQFDDDVAEIDALVSGLTGRPVEPVADDDQLPMLIDLFRRVALDLLAACARTIGGTWVPASSVLGQTLTEAERPLLEDGTLLGRLARAAHDAAGRRTALPNLFADLINLLGRQGPVHLTPRTCRWARRAVLPRKRHILVLDATAEPAVLDGILGRPVTVADLPPVRQQATVYQMMDRIATRRGNRQDLAADDSYLKRLVTEVARRHRGQPLLCISFKNDTEALAELLEREHGQATVVHYGALRGLNRFADYPVGLVVGRPMPNEASLQLLAVAAFGTEALDEDLSPPPLQWQLHTEAIGPDLWTVRRQQYGDPRWQAVWRHLVTGELMQAIGRLRPLTNPATIYVATNELLPSGLDVTAVYAGELFPRLAASGRRSDFLGRVLRYAETAADLEAEGVKPTNRAVCQKLGIRECNGFRYRQLAINRLRGPPG